MISVGLMGYAEVRVESDKTAVSVGSGSLQVFATPMLLALMENAAVNALVGCLEEGYTTVGTRAQLTHSAATPLGMHVRAQAVLKEIDERKLTFSVQAFDEIEMVGEGTHERLIVQEERFFKKVEGKNKEKK